MPRESTLARLARRSSERSIVFALVSAATVLAVAIAGYHPYAEDGGIYAASVMRLLNTHLYPHDAAFAVEPSRWSLFAPAIAGLVRATHIPLAWMLLLQHVVSIWATLFAVWMLAARCFARAEARAGAVLLMACWFGLPVAGTALYVMDPYLTARSFAVPAMLVTICGTLDAARQSTHSRGWALWTTALAVCAVMHPLTAIYTVIATTAIHLQMRRAAKAWQLIALCALLIAAATCASFFAPTESAEFVRAALSRSYWFLSKWRWYEVVGLAAPLMILSASVWFSGTGLAQANDDTARVRRPLALAIATVGATACVVAVLLSREDAATYLIARLQPLRIFQIVYIAMIILLGSWFGEYALKKSAWRWTAAVALLGSAMFAAARAEYPSSDHLELPWATPKNAWVQAFDWTRDNTAKDALFAMDADYIHAAGEDAQDFRAIAQRSVLPDFSKDGGEASIAPDLAEAWVQGVAAQTGLNAISDSERTARLKPLGVVWVVLNVPAKTEFDCPYVNVAVRICRIP